MFLKKALKRKSIFIIIGLIAAYFLISLITQGRDNGDIKQKM